MSKLSIFLSNLKKVRMNYSALVYIEVIIWFLVCFHGSTLRISPGQGQNYQLFGGLLVSVKSIEKLTSTQEQVQKYCNYASKLDN